MLPTRQSLEKVSKDRDVQKLVERGVPLRMAALTFTAPDAPTLIRQAWHNSQALGEELVPRVFSLQLARALVKNMLDAVSRDFYPSKAIEAVFGVQKDGAPPATHQVSSESSFPPDLSNTPIGNLVFAVWRTILLGHDDSDAAPWLWLDDDSTLDCTLDCMLTLEEEMMEALLQGNLPAVFEQLVRTSSLSTNGIAELKKRGFNKIQWDHESLCRIAEGFMSAGQRVELSTCIASPFLEGGLGRLVEFVHKIHPSSFSYQKKRHSNRWLVALDSGKHVLAKSTTLKLLSPPIVYRWAVLTGLARDEFNGAIGEVLRKDDDGRMQFRQWKLVEGPSVLNPLQSNQHFMYQAGFYGQPAYTGPITRNLLAREPIIRVRLQNLVDIGISDLVQVVLLSGLETPSSCVESVCEDIQVPRHLRIFNGEPMTTYEPVHIMRQVGMSLGVVLVSLPDRISDPNDCANPWCTQLMTTSTGWTAHEWDCCGPVLVFRPDGAGFHTSDMKMVLRFVRHFRETFHRRLEENVDAAIAWRDECLTADAFEAWKRQDAENVDITEANFQENPHAGTSVAFGETLQKFPELIPDTDSEYMYEAPELLSPPIDAGFASTLEPNGNMCPGGCRPCTNMLRTGRCRRGDTCEFCHHHSLDAQRARPPRSARIRSNTVSSYACGAPISIGMASHELFARVPVTRGRRMGGVGVRMNKSELMSESFLRIMIAVAGIYANIGFCARCLLFLLVLFVISSSSAVVGLVTVVCILLGMIAVGSDSDALVRDGQ